MPGEKKDYSQQEHESESYYEQKLILQHSKQILRFWLLYMNINNSYMHESKLWCIKLIDALDVIFQINITTSQEFHLMQLISFLLLHK